MNYTGTETNRLYHGDCMEFMEGVEDNFYDLAIVDPPYGIFTENNKTGYLREYKTSSGANEWDKRPDSDYFKELFRVSKDQIIWGMQYFSADLPDFSQPLIWDKKTGDSYFADAELAFCSIKGTARTFRHQWAGAFKDSERKEPIIQACQKPLALYFWLLEKYATPGMKILDTHSGSGSLRIPAHKLGFYIDSVERSYDNFKGNSNRFNDYLKSAIEQIQLFSVEEIQKSVYKQEELFEKTP